MTDKLPIRYFEIIRHADEKTTSVCEYPPEFGKWVYDKSENTYRTMVARVIILFCSDDPIDKVELALLKGIVTSPQLEWEEVDLSKLNGNQS